MRLVQTKYETKCRLKKGDEVIVLAGEEKGSKGKIDRVDYKSGRVYVTGVNIAKRHSRPNMSNQEGGIIEKVLPLPFGKVALLDPKSKNPSRIGYKVDGGKKVRFSKDSGSIL